MEWTPAKLSTPLNFSVSLTFKLVRAKQTKSRRGLTTHVLYLSWNFRNYWFVFRPRIQTFVKLGLDCAPGSHHWQPLGYLGGKLEANNNAKVNSSLTSSLSSCWCQSHWINTDVGNWKPFFFQLRATKRGFFAEWKFSRRFSVIFFDNYVHIEGRKSLSHNHSCRPDAVYKVTMGLWHFLWQLRKLLFGFLRQQNLRATQRKRQPGQHRGELRSTRSTLSLVRDFSLIGESQHNGSVTMHHN